MNFQQNLQLSYIVPGTTESEVGLSGKHFPNTRDAKQFDFLTSTRVNLLDTESYFTQKEEEEIFQSLIDLRLGNYKTFHTTEELFADLDR
jgi:hypothetical protein